MKQWVQLQLERQEGESTISTTVCVEYNKKAKLIKLGSQISLKGETERWTVTGMHDMGSRPNRGWDNNI